MSSLIELTRGMVKATSGTLPHYFTSEEVNRILSACRNQQERVVIRFLWQTGVRAEEALGVRWLDVNFHDRLVRVVTLKKKMRKARGRRPTREHERTIPMDDALTSSFLLWKEEMQRKAERSRSSERRERIMEYVFPFSYSRLYQLVRGIVLRAGLDEERAHPHTFRHSFAVHLLKQGVPITVVQQLLGHSSIENTVIYTVIIQQEVREFLKGVRW